jgi:hypothetical protein
LVDIPLGFIIVTNLHLFSDMFIYRIIQSQSRALTSNNYIYVSIEI